MTWFIAGALLPSFLTCLVLTALMRRAARPLGLIDQPGDRKLHARPMPLGGGVAIWAAVVLALGCGQLLVSQWQKTGTAALEPLRTRLTAPLLDFAQPYLPGVAAQKGALWIVLGSATLLMLLGLVDDLVRLDWRLRIAVQVAVAVVVVAMTDWSSTLFLHLPWLTGAVSVLWIVGLANSFNMLDNMDGLSAGVAFIAACMLAAVMLISRDPQTGQPQLFVAGFLLVLAGSLLGFLPHNWHPARIFMGDAGSYFIGYCLALSSLLATFAGGTLPAHAILTPLCVFAVPLYDMVSVIWIRLRAGHSPFVGDKNHFSHRLVELGLSQRQAVATIYLATLACGLAGLLLHQVTKAGAVAVVLLVLCMLALIGILETSGRRAKLGASVANRVAGSNRSQ